MVSAVTVVGRGNFTEVFSSNINVHKDFSWSKSKVQALKNCQQAVPSLVASLVAADRVYRRDFQEQAYSHGNYISMCAYPVHSYGATTSAWRPSPLEYIAFSTLTKNIRMQEQVDFLPIERTRHTVEHKKLGLSEELVRRVSRGNNEPEWMLQFRLDAFQQLLTMEEPQGARCPPIDFRAMFDHSAITSDHHRQSQGIVQDGGEICESSEDSFAMVHKEALEGTGVIFCSIAEAIRDHPDLVRKYLGKVVPPSDNFYAALNSAIFVDGVFCYVPENVICPMDISTYFLVDGRKTSSPFERTLIVCDENAVVSSLGCTSPPLPQAAEVTRSSGQELHAPVIELLCAAGGEIKHVTVQNWLEPGATASTDEAAQEELLCNFVTQRGLCAGARAKIRWTIVEAGSGVTWQHPAVVLKGDGSVGECFSVTLTNGRQQADTGATMIHSGSGTRSRIVCKTISAGSSQSYVRGVVHVEPWSSNAKSSIEQDAILIGDYTESTSCPSVVVRNATAKIEEKGSTSKLSKEQVFYFQQRGIQATKAAPAILTGFCDEVLRELPLEFESEVREMVADKIEEFVTGSTL